MGKLPDAPKVATLSAAAPMAVGGPRRRTATRAVRRGAAGLASVTSFGRWLLLCGLFLAVGLAMRTAWMRLVDSPRLQVGRIEVVGNKRTTPAEILAYSGARYAVPIMALDLDAMALRLRQHPWIAKATIRRQLPERLHIHIVEHEPVLLVALGALYLADARGLLFKRFAAWDQIDAPVVTGIDRQGAAQHSDEVARRLRVAVQLAQAVAEQGEDLGRLEEVHWDEDLGWQIVLQPNAASQLEALALRPGVRAQLGHMPLERLSRVAATLRVLAEHQQTPDVIWADGDRTPDKVSVELLAERQSPSTVAPKGRL